MFLTNAYSEEYYKIINDRKIQHKDSVYCEKHHIIPKSLGGPNNRDNLVYLSAKDHFRCHQLLVQFTEGEAKSKMWSGLWRMMNKQSRNQERDYDILPEDYEAARKAHAKHQSDRMTGESNPFFGKRHSAETKEQMSKSKKGKSYEEIYGVEHASDMKEKRRIETTGKKRSAETKEKIRQHKLGKPRDPELMKTIGEKLRGRIRPAAVLEKTRATNIANRKECPHCKKITSQSNHTKWHGDNCKLKGSE